ncbi:hypothetical protein AGOR_G00200390 [Albula goreensis]|uniref:Uncharacterized protein n=1 Tax=Albula goreensis TaxID=1534307 RepID=A0A8T3CW93_9TELE|nr:hypothetical protein AGOR_G00200390 [Albula goreensis]
MEETIQGEEDGDEEDIEIDKETFKSQLLLIEELKKKLHEEEYEKLSMESRIREEVTNEFMDLFSKMEDDYSERLAKEKEIIEERAERRLEILKGLVNKNSTDEAALNSCTEQTKEDKGLLLDGMMGSMQGDLDRIKKDAEAAQTCLIGLLDPHNTNLEKQVAELSEELLKTQQLLTLKTREVESMCSQVQQSNEELKDAEKNCDSQTRKFQELMEICQEKDDMITKLQTAMDHHVETATKDRALIDAVREEILNLKENCKCSNKSSSHRESRKRLADLQEDLNEQPPTKKGIHEENLRTMDDNKIQEKECNKESNISPINEKQIGLQQLETTRWDFQNEVKLRDEQLEELKQQCTALERKVSQLLDDLKQKTDTCEAALSSLEMERKEKAELVKEKEILATQASALQRDAEEVTRKINAIEITVGEREQKIETLSEELKSAKTLLMKHNNESREKSKLIECLQQETVQLKQEMEKSKAVLVRSNGNHFHHTMESLHKECENMVNESAQKNQKICDLEQEVTHLRQLIAEQEELSEKLKQEPDDLREKTNGDLRCWETEKKATEELKRNYCELEAEVVTLREQVQTQAKASSSNTIAELEKRLADKDSAVGALQKSLEETKNRLEEMESASLQEARRREAERRRELLRTAEEAIALKDAEVEKKAQELLRVKEELTSSLDKIRTLSLDLQRKEDDVSDMKEKLADSKKQIQQVQKEISCMRDEGASLRQKLNESEKTRSQLLSDLHNKDKNIQQLKSEQANNGNLQLYQKACTDLQTKEQVIEGMRLALMEQEETQTKQDQVLEDKLNEIESLTEEIKTLKERFLLQNKDSFRNSAVMEECHSSEYAHAKQELEKTEESLKLSNVKYQADKKKWLEEKLLLIRQVKEAEERRNQDMKKYADDRMHHNKLQTEVESLSKQLLEKDNDLLKWRQERDSLVAALEIQMKKLASSNMEKDQKLKELQSQNSNSVPQENIQENVSDCQSSESNQSPPLMEKCEGRTQGTEAAFKKPQGFSDKSKGDVGSSRSSEENEMSVLDSSDLSTENGRPSRFPKPELEIQFTPLQPNKMCVKQQGGDTAVTVKITRSGRKRKSAEMEKDPVDSENRKNTRLRGTSTVPAVCESPGTLRKRTDHVRHEHSQSSLRSKKDGTLQKIGDFIQSSPTLLGSKAKKIIGFVSAKSPEPEGNTTISLKPKKSKRKLYKTEISSPLDIPSHPIIGLDQEEKESDHLIIKRRLRTRTARN